MLGVNEYEGISLPWDFFLIPEAPVQEGRDSHGKYFIMTGMEGSGNCWLCGADPGGKKYRRYCWGHGTLYCELFIWTYASPAALKRDDYKCRNCGGHAGVEVHHIIPQFMPCLPSRDPCHYAPGWMDQTIIKGRISGTNDLRRPGMKGGTDL